MSANSKAWGRLNRIGDTLDQLKSDVKDLKKQAEHNQQQLHDINTKLDLMGNKDFLMDGIKQQIAALEIQMSDAQKVKAAITRANMDVPQEPTS